MSIRYLNRSRGSGSGSSFYDFTLGSLPAGVSFTRASTGWRFNSSGVLVPETTDVARFQYDPATLTPRGLLVEEARTELLTYSEEMDRGTKVRSSVSSNAAAGPDGTTTADKLVEDSTASNSHYLEALSVSYTSGVTYVHSVFAKAAGRDWMRMGVPAGASHPAISGTTWFDLANGVLGTVGASATAFMRNCGNGWYHCTLIYTATTTTSGKLLFAPATGNNNANYNGDGTSGILLWGAQAQVGTATGSYIKSAGSTVARAADVALLTNPSALVDQCQVIKFRTPRKISGGAANVAWQRDDGTTSNCELVRYGSDGKVHVVTTVGGVDVCDLDMGAVAADTDVTIAARFTTGAFAASLNGAAIVSYAGGTRPAGLTTARLGKGVSGFALNSTVRSLWSIPTASNTDLPLLAA